MFGCEVLKTPIKVVSFRERSKKSQSFAFGFVPIKKIPEPSVQPVKFGPLKK
jgi:hypothetical protein